MQPKQPWNSQGAATLQNENKLHRLHTWAHADSRTAQEKGVHL